MNISYVDAYLPLPPSLHDKSGAEARKIFREECETRFNQQELDPNNLYDITVTFYGPKWRKKNGKPDRKAPDTLNMTKVAEDEIMRALRLDDCHNFDYHVKKRAGPAGCAVTIRPLEETVYLQESMEIPPPGMV